MLSVRCYSLLIGCGLPLAEPPRCFAVAVVTPDNQHRLPLSLGAACALRLGGTTEATGSPMLAQAQLPARRLRPIGIDHKREGRGNLLPQPRGGGCVGKLGSHSRTDGSAVQRPLPPGASHDRSSR